MVATFPTTPSLFLLKSITRYFFLFPPPICLVVITPWLFLPPVLLNETTNDFSGVLLVVISSNVVLVIARRLAVVGLYVLIAIFSFSYIYIRECLSLYKDQLLRHL